MKSADKSPDQLPVNFPSNAPKFVCLNCGMEMINRQCKVRCARCGYFEDCSDGTGDHVNIQVPNA